MRLAASSDGFRPLLSRTPSLPLGEDEVLVRVKAASLNYRDLLIRRGVYPGIREGLIPLSDAAGRVLAVGSAVSRWAEGDRVMANFFLDWVDGPYRSAYRSSALGGERSGVLAETIVVPAHALVAVPEHLSFEEAATLPCAAVTAWHALFGRERRLQAGDTLLLQGTGGVATFALQFAAALGARPIVMSSADSKLRCARALGAWQTLNYQKRTDWDQAVREMTQGEGVQHVLELGGPETFERSLNSLADGGQVAQVGVLTGFEVRPDLAALQRLNASVAGVLVGSVEHFEQMCGFVSQHRLLPHVDRIFEFAAATEAYEYLQAGRHFGKIVVRI